MVERNDEMLMKFKQLGIVKGILSIVAVMGALVCIGYGLHYQFVYKQSPEYSLRILYKSIQDGDTDTFFAMVDGEGILHRVFDPYIEKLLKESDVKEVLLNQDLKAHIPHRPDPKDPFKDNLQTLKEVGRYELISIKEKNKNDSRQGQEQKW